MKNAHQLVWPAALALAAHIDTAFINLAWLRSSSQLLWSKDVQSVDIKSIPVGLCSMIQSGIPQTTVGTAWIQLGFNWQFHLPESARLNPFQEFLQHLRGYFGASSLADSTEPAKKWRQCKRITPCSWMFRRSRKNPASARPKISICCPWVLHTHACTATSNNVSHLRPECDKG